jgi:Uncharacterized MobA-related protein
MSALSNNEIAVLVLAAGGGSRLGGDKLLLPWRGKAIFLHTLDHILAMRHKGPVFVVIGCGADSVRRMCPDNVQIVENTEWRDGQSTSLRLGVSRIAEWNGFPGLIGVLVALGDQPLVKAETMDQLATAHRDALRRNPGHGATAPSYQGRRGNPVVLSPALFQDIAELRGDVGARGILSRLGDSLLLVSVDDPGVVKDIDTQEEYSSLP